MRKIEFTCEQLKNIYNLYTQDGVSMAKIGEQYNVSRTVIKRLLKEGNIEIKKDNHVYKADYRKFQNLDSPEKAYWLGFIAADGNVYIREQNATVQVYQHQKDRTHLEKFREFMNSNVQIKDYINDSGYSNKDNPTPMSVIAFNSKDMANDLVALGVVPNKSLILEPPKIKEEFYLPYILGLFDGDGTIFHFNNNTEYTIGFTGALKTIEWVNEILQMDAKLEQRVEGSQTYYIRCGGINKPYNIMKKLYDSVNIHLERKYELFKELETVVHKRNFM